MKLANLLPTSRRWRLPISIVGFFVAAFWLFAFSYHRLAKSNFEAYDAELAARGESLEVDALRPPPIENPEEDVAAAPVFAGLLERCLADPGAETEDDPVWGELGPLAVPGFSSQNVQRPDKRVRYLTYPALSHGFDSPDEAAAAEVYLDHGKAHAEALNEIREALARPRADFKAPYGDFTAIFPGLNHFGGTGKFLHSHGQAALLLGQSALARSDVIAMLRLSRHVSSQATLIHLLIGIAVHDLAIPLIQEGLDKGDWSEADLFAFEGELESEWIEEAFLSAVRMERAGAIVSPEPDLGETESFAEPLPTWIRILHCVPDLRKGWQYDNMEHYCRSLQESVLEDDKGVRLTTRLATPLRDLPMILPAGSDPRDQFRFLVEAYRHGFAEAGFGAFTGIRMSALRSRVYRDHARIAVSLALHRNRHGQYPTNLEALSFSENAPLPLDPFTGVGYIYRPLDGEDYLLYSPGPDSRDDGGLIRYDYKKGDWVWRLHLPEDFDFEAYRGR
jgi:hypothetical protein